MLTSSSIGHRHLCQAQAAGVIIQSAVIIQDPCSKKLPGLKLSIFVFFLLPNSLLEQAEEITQREGVSHTD